MSRERALQFALVVIGLLFTAAIYPVASILWNRDQAGYTDAMMGAIYITLGILLLLSVRNPWAHRSLIAFAAWSSFAHAFVMAIMGLRDASARQDHLLGVAIFTAVGLPLLVLRPSRPPITES
ncbi:MAG: hypothetical protein JOZ80_17495 [Acidobacteriaceae bacterium]|nr:hypothetical protein [Acidobacteriaceae bacterium]